MFIVQESIHADHVSRHETREEAIAAIEEMIREGLAERGRVQHPRDRRRRQDRTRLQRA
jgi:hypothetical protein